MPRFPTYYGPPLPDQLNLLDPRHWWMLLTWVFFYPSRFKHYLYQADPELYRGKGISIWIKILQQPSYRPLGILFFLIAPPTMYFFAREGSILIVDEVNELYVIIYSGISLLFLIFRNNKDMLVGNISFLLSLPIVFGILYSLSFFINVNILVYIYTAFGFAMAVSTRASSVYGIIYGLLYGILLSLGSLNILVGASIVGLVIGSLLPSLVLPTGSNNITRTILFIDELGDPHFSNTRHIYTQSLKSVPEKALQTLAPLFQDIFHCHIAFRFINDVLYDSDDPIYLLYTWLRSSQMEEYIFPPIGNDQFERIPTLRRALLCSLANESMSISGAGSERIGRFSWNIARFIYGSRADHPLIPLARLLLRLEQLGNVRGDIDQLLLDTLDDMDLSLLREYEYGIEIIDSFEIMKRAFEVDSIMSIASLRPDLIKDHTKYSNPLRPEVWEIIAALADISGEIVDYTRASSPNTRKSTLNRATGLLNQLVPQRRHRPHTDLTPTSTVNISGFRERKQIDIMSYVEVPEKYLLNEIAEYWQVLIAEEAGLVGERDLREMDIVEQRTMEGRLHRSVLWEQPPLPFYNPYITGKPVRPPIFVERKDIMDEIAERWRSTSHTPDSIILYGHRRMGKTSIVQNLARYASPGSVLVYLDLKGAMVMTDQMGDLLYNIATDIHRAVGDIYPDLPRPQYIDYQQSKSADICFQNILRKVIACLPDKAILILALDEFEALEQAVEMGMLPENAYDYLRMLSQWPRLMLILAGLHTLDEMSRDYQQAFFSSYMNIRVSYLEYRDSERLIARPTPDFILNYEQTVIHEIHDCTHGQPLLIQSICSALVNHVNHELFDLELERPARVSSDDLEDILTNNFIRQESRYFDGIWQDQIAEFPDQQRLLSRLAKYDDGMTADRLMDALGLSTARIDETLQALVKRDLITEEGGRWRLMMPLFKRWLQLRADDLEDEETQRTTTN